MDMKRLDNTVAFITGASSGIGAALAEEYARCGADVVLAARRTDRLDEVAEEVRRHGRRVLAIACDVTVDGDLERAVAQAVEEFGRIDWLIANAGFGVAGPLDKLELEDYRRQFETNVFGVLRTIYAGREALLSSKGCLAIVGSVAGYLAMAKSSPYAMSKFAVHALADSLRYEMAPHGVGVTLVVPGFISSEIRMVDNRGQFKPERKEPMPAWLPMPAPVAAKKIVRAVTGRRRQLLLTGHGRFAVVFQRHFPGTLAFLVSRFGGKRR
jgi:short-subunit dehydrogenase